MNTMCICVKRSELPSPTLHSTRLARFTVPNAPYECGLPCNAHQSAWRLLYTIAGQGQASLREAACIFEHLSLQACKVSKPICLPVCGGRLYPIPTQDAVIRGRSPLPVPGICSACCLVQVSTSVEERGKALINAGNTHMFRVHTG